jgi:DNA-binding response OmpR family regulator
MVTNGWQRTTVLIGDPNEESRAQLGNIVRGAGYHVLEVKESGDALVLLKQGLVDVAIVEAQFSDRAGADILQEWRKGAAQVPVILVTSSWNLKRAVEAMKKGAWDYLTRPIYKSDLLLAIQSALGASRAGVASPGPPRRNYLRHVQKMEAVAPLADAVIHDFNNVLTVILSYCAVLKKGLGEREALQHYVAEITRAAQRGSVLTRPLLEFAGKQPLVQDSPPDGSAQPDPQPAPPFDRK